MILHSLDERQRQLIVDFMAEEMQAYAVILFGSAARGALRPESDVDIAYLSDATCSAYERFMTAQRLADLLKREVDLVDFRQASTVLQAQIVGNGVILCDRQPIERQVAFMYALKAYALSNEERHEILQAYDAASEEMNGGDGHYPEQDGNDRSLRTESP